MHFLGSLLFAGHTDFSARALHDALLLCVRNLYNSSINVAELGATNPLSTQSSAVPIHVGVLLEHRKQENDGGDEQSGTDGPHDSLEHYWTHEKTPFDRLRRVLPAPLSLAHCRHIFRLDTSYMYASLLVRSWPFSQEVKGEGMGTTFAIGSTNLLVAL